MRSTVIRDISTLQNAFYERQIKQVCIQACLVVTDYTTREKNLAELADIMLTLKRIQN